MTSVDAMESNEKVNDKNIDNVKDIQKTEVPTPAAIEIGMSSVNDSSDVMSKPDIVSIPSGETLMVPETESILMTSSENTEGTNIGSSSNQNKSPEVDLKKDSETKTKKKKKKTAKAKG